MTKLYFDSCSAAFSNRKKYFQNIFYQFRVGKRFRNTNSLYELTNIFIKNNNTVRQN